jgi:hypothetical protein
MARGSGHGSTITLTAKPGQVQVLYSRLLTIDPVPVMQALPELSPYGRIWSQSRAYAAESQRPARLEPWSFSHLYDDLVIPIRTGQWYGVTITLPDRPGITTPGTIVGDASVIRARPPVLASQLPMIQLLALQWHSEPIWTPSA